MSDETSATQRLAGEDRMLDAFELGKLWTITLRTTPAHLMNMLTQWINEHPPTIEENISYGFNGLAHRVINAPMDGPHLNQWRSPSSLFNFRPSDDGAKTQILTWECTHEIVRESNESDVHFVVPVRMLEFRATALNSPGPAELTDVGSYLHASAFWRFYFEIWRWLESLPVAVGHKRMQSRQPSPAQPSSNADTPAAPPAPEPAAEPANSEVVPAPGPLWRTYTSVVQGGREFRKRRTSIDVYRRWVREVELRQAGLTYKEIAERLALQGVEENDVKKDFNIMREFGVWNEHSTPAK